MLLRTSRRCQSRLHFYGVLIPPCVPQQWNYHTHNAGVQGALAAWRPLLYWVRFDLVSDHASLRHFFHRRRRQPVSCDCVNSLPISISRRYSLSGARTMGCHFPNRPWSADCLDARLYALSHLRVEIASTLAALNCVGFRGSLELWRADVPVTCPPPIFASVGLQLRPTEGGAQLRDVWRRVHFDAL